MSRRCSTNTITISTGSDNSPSSVITDTDIEINHTKKNNGRRISHNQHNDSGSASISAIRQRQHLPPPPPPPRRSRKTNERPTTPSVKWDLPSDHGREKSSSFRPPPPPPRRRIPDREQLAVEKKISLPSNSHSSVNNSPSIKAYVEYYDNRVSLPQKQSESSISYRTAEVRSDTNSINNTGSIRIEHRHEVTSTCRRKNSSSRSVTSSSSRGRTRSSGASFHSEGHPHSDPDLATAAATTSGPPVTAPRSASRSRSRTKSRSVAISPPPPAKQPIEAQVESGEVMHDDSTHLMMTTRMNSIWNQVSNYIDELGCKDQLTDTQGYLPKPPVVCKDGSDGVRLAMAVLPTSSDEESSAEEEEEEIRKKNAIPKRQCSRSGSRRRSRSKERGTFALADSIKLQHKKIYKKKTTSAGRPTSADAKRKIYTTTSTRNKVMDGVPNQSTSRGRRSISALAKRRSSRIAPITSERAIKEGNNCSPKTDLFGNPGSLVGPSSPRLGEIPNETTVKGRRSTSALAKRRSSRAATSKSNRALKEDRFRASKTDSFGNTVSLAGTSSNSDEAPHQTNVQGKISTSTLTKRRSFHTTTSINISAIKEDRFSALGINLLGHPGSLADPPSSNSNFDEAPNKTPVRSRRSTSAIAKRSSFHSTTSTSAGPFKEVHFNSSGTDLLGQSGGPGGPSSSKLDEAPNETPVRGRRSTSALAKKTIKGDRVCLSAVTKRSFHNSTNTSNAHLKLKGDDVCSSNTDFFGKPASLHSPSQSNSIEVPRRTATNGNRGSSSVLAAGKSTNPNWVMSSVMRSFHSNDSQGANEAKITGKGERSYVARRHRSPSLTRHRSPSLTRHRSPSLSRRAKQALSAMEATVSSSNSAPSNQMEMDNSKASMVYDVAFDPITGRCHYHPTVCMAVRHEDNIEKGSGGRGGSTDVTIVGGWKVVRTSCPKCTYNY